MTGPLDTRIEVDPSTPRGELVGVKVDGLACVVVHHAQGWSMFEDRCTHARCSFVNDGGEVVDGTTLVCACHGSEFDLRDGSVLLGPATEPLEVIPLQRDGDVFRPVWGEPGADP